MFNLYQNSHRNKVYPINFQRTCIDVADFTGPLDALRGRSVLHIQDVENSTFHAKNKLKAKVSYSRLREKILAASDFSEFHAVFSRHPGTDNWERYFDSRGWVSHPRDIFNFGGIKPEANADPSILFTTGWLLATWVPDILLIGSGDGRLVEELARAVRLKMTSPPKIITLSMAGATHHRLNANSNPLIMGNIEIGRDCLHNLYPVNNFSR